MENIPTVPFVVTKVTESKVVRT